jgi:hypothetical protein
VTCKLAYGEMAKFRLETVIKSVAGQECDIEKLRDKEKDEILVEATRKFYIGVDPRHVPGIYMDDQKQQPEINSIKDLPAMSISQEFLEIL